MTRMLPCNSMSLLCKARRCALSKAYFAKRSDASSPTPRAGSSCARKASVSASAFAKSDSAAEARARSLSRWILRSFASANSAWTCASFLPRSKITRCSCETCSAWAICNSETAFASTSRCTASPSRCLASAADSRFEDSSAARTFSSWTCTASSFACDSLPAWAMAFSALLFEAQSCAWRSDALERSAATSTSSPSESDRSALRSRAHLRSESPALRELFVDTDSNSRRRRAISRIDVASTSECTRLFDSSCCWNAAVWRSASASSALAASSSRLRTASASEACLMAVLCSSRWADCASRSVFRTCNSRFAEAAAASPRRALCCAALEAAPTASSSALAKTSASNASAARASAFSDRARAAEANASFALVRRSMSARSVAASPSKAACEAAARRSAALRCASSWATDASRAASS
mmetsp:Transcript_21851/g.74079  ORF Transcript_21851/g.74079 Transcript_21851/m.74079 type:complete len:415 (-) Transcript_21851:1824-3068(-)